MESYLHAKVKEFNTQDSTVLEKGLKVVSTQGVMRPSVPNRAGART